MKSYLKYMVPLFLSLVVAGLLLSIFVSPSESAPSVRDNALAAIRSIGPMKIVATDEVLDAEGNTVSKSRIDQLLDARACLARETVTDLASGEVISDRSIVGNESTSVQYGVKYIGHVVALEPPASELTVWGGYEELLSVGLPVELTDSGQGQRLVVTLEEGDVTVFLGDDLLPDRIETSPADSQKGEVPARRITYDSIEQVASLSASDVELSSLPENPIVVENHRLLPLDNPKIPEQVPFAQYGLGAEVLGRQLAYAEHAQFMPRPDYEPTGINGLVLIYWAPGGEARNIDKDIQLTCHPTKGDTAETRVASYRSKLADGRHQLWQRVVAGQRADVLVELDGVDSSHINRAFVVLSDSVVEVDAHLSISDFDELLKSIQALK
jgi:hypothetical protein